MRKIPEWIGKTDDDRIPDRVRVNFYDNAIPEPNSGCWLWIGPILTNGYPVVNFNRRRRYAHRVSFQITNGKIPDGMNICHKCDVPLCVNPDHLFIGTQADNMRDCANKGRIRVPGLRGSFHNMAKLSESDVLAIRNDPRSLNVLAAKYGVSKTTISEVKSRKLWRHI